MSVSIEYNLSDSDLELEDVVIRVPLEWVDAALLANCSWLKWCSYDRQTARDINLTFGEYSDTEKFLAWELPRINHEEPAGTLEFSCESGNSDSFFPIEVDFKCGNSLCGIRVSRIHRHV